MAHSFFNRIFFFNVAHLIVIAALYNLPLQDRTSFIFKSLSLCTYIRVVTNAYRVFTNLFTRTWHALSACQDKGVDEHGPESQPCPRYKVEQRGRCYIDEVFGMSSIRRNTPVHMYLY